MAAARKIYLSTLLINVSCNARHFYEQAQTQDSQVNVPTEEAAFLERMGDQITSVAIQIGAAIRGEPSTIPAPGALVPPMDPAITAPMSPAPISASP